MIGAVKVFETLLHHKWGEALGEAGETALGLAPSGAGGAAGAATTEE